MIMVIDPKFYGLKGRGVLVYVIFNLLHCAWTVSLFIYLVIHLFSYLTLFLV